MYNKNKAYLKKGLRRALHLDMLFQIKKSQRCTMSLDREIWVPRSKKYELRKSENKFPFFKKAYFLRKTLPRS
jgi:hypothetical protein